MIEKSQPKDQTGNKKLRQILYDESRMANGISAYFKMKNTLDFYHSGHFALSDAIIVRYNNNSAIQ